MESEDKDKAQNQESNGGEKKAATEEKEKKKVPRLKWLPGETEFLQGLCAEAKSGRELTQKCRDHMDKFQPGRTLNAIASKCRQHPSWCQHFAPPAHQAGDHAAEGNGFNQKLTDFLIGAKTVKQIADKFGIKPEEAEKVLQNPPPGYRLGKQPNQIGEDCYVLLPEMTASVKSKEKTWTYRRHETDPYLIINFPPDKKWKKINIVPIADVFFGDALHNEVLFDEYINWISQNPHVFAFFNGNIIKKFTSAEKDIVADCATKLQCKLSRIAHKILWAQPGDNEEATSKVCGFDPLQLICDELGVPFFTEPVHIDIFWGEPTKPFTFFCFHGRSNALTKGGRLNSVLRVLEYIEFTMFIVMAHVKDRMVNSIIKISRNASLFDLEKKKEYLIICPSFINYFGSEIAKKGYKPNSVGTVSCRLYRDGKYWTSS